MTGDQMRAVGSVFARYLGGFERSFDSRSVEYLRSYCRGLLTDLPRKSVEPIALSWGDRRQPPREPFQDGGRPRPTVR